MFGFIGETVGKMLGTDKAAKSLIDNVSSGLDKLIYTDEEKAGDKALAVTEARQMVIKWLEATSGQNLARRLLALMITIVWLVQYVVMLVMALAGVWLNEVEKFNISADVIGGYAESMKGAVMLILAFYFAAPHMGSIVTGALEKFGQNKK